jgi:two-component sensor histidine kinase
MIQADDIVAMAVSGSGTRGMEAVAPEAPKSKDYLVSAAPLQVAGDEISGCVITMVDLSQRKAAERQQLLLMHELDHRVKNTLALVLSISSRTLSAEETLEGFQKAFTGRIQALAATHTLLADKSWADLSVRELLTAELAPYVDASSDRLGIEGLDFDITPRAAIALGLVLHELATNAVKYGALSTEAGRISVRALPRAPDGKSVTLEWQEQGGPVVSAPSRKGFGHTVIGRSLRYSPHGGAELDFTPTGLACRVFIPADDLR